MTSEQLRTDLPEPRTPRLPSPRPLAPGAHPVDVEQVHVLRLLIPLLKRWRIVVLLPLIGAAVVVAVSFAMRPLFTATTAFVPESRSQSRLPASLAGLAGQIGISLDADGSQSPRFYSELARSREIMASVLRSRFSDPRTAAPADSATLAGILDIETANMDGATKKFERFVRARVDNQTGIVRLSVDAPFPGLAADVANRFIEQLNEFNAERRQSQARTSRIFIEQRIGESERELRAAEEGLKVFYERNRSWEQAPQLRFEEARLQRQLDILKEVYVTLKREFETSRIEEVNDSPVITVIDPAVAPYSRSQPNRTQMAALALAFGVVVSLVWVYGADFFDRMRREQSGEYVEFVHLAQQTGSNIKRTVRGAFAREH